MRVHQLRTPPPYQLCEPAGGRRVGDDAAIAGDQRQCVHRHIELRVPRRLDRAGNLDIVAEEGQAGGESRDHLGRPALRRLNDHQHARHARQHRATPVAGATMLRFHAG
jgi:hypothetical protein